jgi:hypothetical protein
MRSSRKWPWNDQGQNFEKPWKTGEFQWIDPRILKCQKAGGQEMGFSSEFTTAWKGGHSWIVPLDRLGTPSPPENAGKARDWHGNVIADLLSVV